jgi:hypothetical protein
MTETPPKCPWCGTKFADLAQLADKLTRYEAVAEAAKRLMALSDDLALTSEMSYLSTFDETVDALKAALASLSETNGNELLDSPLDSGII